MDKLRFNLKGLVALTIFTWFLFSVYSFSQVDLNLTLTVQPLYLFFQKNMTHLGYFNRLLSSAIFVFLILALTGMYLLILSRALAGKITTNIWAIIVPVYILALFAYPAFSYDIFNYIFDARIVTTHHLSPYYFKALDFPDDSWTRFMRWTHRYYPYGPLWLLLTIIPSVLGFGRFLSTLFLFKLLFLIGAIANVLVIRSIAKRIAPKYVEAVTIFFALNPLVVIESVLSPHNEVFLLLFALLGIYFLLQKRFLFSLLFIFVSAGIKFLTLIFLPVFVLKKWRGDKLGDKMLVILLTLSFIVTLIPLIIMREPYPWYFIPILALSSFFVEKTLVRSIVIGLTLGEIFRYLPYLWNGNWDYPVPVVNLWITVSGVLFGIMMGGLNLLFTHKQAKLQKGFGQ